jgi:hypothetical protein
MAQRKTPAEKRNGYIRPHIIPGTLIYDDKTDSYKTRFSQIYKPAGLNFTRAFQVIYQSYWQRFQLFQREVSKTAKKRRWDECGYDVVNLYNLLNYFADTDTTFRLRGLCAQTKVGHSTLMQYIDILENAELISRVCLADTRGQPNYYVMRTPLFESLASLTDKVKARIRRAGEDLPAVFLVNELPRLRRAVKENLARQRRENPEKFPGEIERESQWTNTLRAFDGEMRPALIFDRIVADIAAGYAGRHLPLEAFDKILSAKCKREGIELTRRLRDQAHNNRAFYESYHVDIRPASGLPTAAKVDLGEYLRTFRDLLDHGYTPQKLHEQFAQSFTDADWARIEKALFLNG